jgi:5'-deoxynucleotidase YfbR-like HD superfamily hydrolase
MNESDAEHTGQMQVLATNIIDKAEEENDTTTAQLDVRLVLRMIQVHDIAESLVGDSRKKDAVYYEKEKSANEHIQRKVEILNYSDRLNEAIVEYEDKKMAEARFVKAIDELQAWFYILYTRRFDASNRDLSKPETIVGYEYSKEFPTLHRIMTIMMRILKNPKFIKSDVPLHELTAD